MAGLWDKTLNIGSNASGAAAAGREKRVVMIVDIIDMSTTAEAVKEAGAVEIYGASPALHQAPVQLNPEKIGYIAGKKAVKLRTGIIAVAEPRIMEKNEERKKNIKSVMAGTEKAGGKISKIVPNLGKETVKLAKFKNRIVIIISSAGGTAFDAAFTGGAVKVITGTIASTNKLKGDEPAEKAAERAIKIADELKTGISIIASSSNARED
ncbi:MAG: hypothetical protein ACOCQ5_04690, partial [Halanaerobiales bacterium]